MSNRLKLCAREALAIKDACNLSGVIQSFSKTLGYLWEEARAQNKGTEWVNTHPICVLFSDKIAHLTGYQFDTTNMVESYNKVKEMVEAA